MTDNSRITNPKALVMAGGTGGHIFPGLAVAQELKEQGWSLQWLGSKGGMEEELVSKHNIPLNLIAISGLRGNGLVGWLKSPFSLAHAIWQAMSVIRDVSPDVILGFGGFASGPGGFAAFLMGKKLVIHEQNAVAGLTNRLLSKVANKVFQAFPKTFAEKVNAETIGNPIRAEIGDIDVDRTAGKNAQLNLLIIGGSRGAQALNLNLPGILSSALDAEEIKVIHQCGKTGLEDTTASYSRCLHRTNRLPEVVKFIDDMAEAYHWADLVICRAGALTVSEIAAVGLAAIFIPYPHAVDDHQTRNAEWLESNEAAMIIQQSELTSEAVQLKVQGLLSDRTMIDTMANNAKQIAYRHATSQMSNACIDIMEKAA